MVFRTQFNYNGDRGERNNGLASMTVPDQSYTVRELLQKFTSGGMPDVAKVPQYEEDPDFDDIDPTRLPDFDLADLTELQLELDQRKATLDAYIAEQQAKNVESESQDETPSEATT